MQEHGSWLGNTELPLPQPGGQARTRYRTVRDVCALTALPAVRTRHGCLSACLSVCRSPAR